MGISAIHPKYKIKNIKSMSKTRFNQNCSLMLN